jgi:hypothetical protein
MKIAAVVVTVLAAAWSASPAGAALPTPTLTSARCAAAWNVHPEAAALTLVRRKHVWQGTAAKTTVRNTGSTKLSLGCSIAFFVPHAGAILVSGTWANGMIAWHAPLVQSSSSRMQVGNACVAADGTIHHVGAFTARSRCPQR